MSDKGRDSGIHRRLVELARWSHLQQPSVAHHGDLVGDRECLFLIVSHQQRGDAGRALHPQDLVAHLQSESGVERRQRLVEQQATRFEHQRAGQRDALLLAARERCGIIVCTVAHADPLQHLHRAGAPLLPGSAAHLQRIGDVLPETHVRKQRIGLEHDTEAACLRQLRADILPVDQHAAGRRLDEPGQQLEYGGLAGAGCADDGQQFAAADLQRDVEHAGGRAGIGVADVLIPQGHATAFPLLTPANCAVRLLASEAMMASVSSTTVAAQANPVAP